MKALRHRGVRIASVILFAALLFVPLLESGHSHAKSDLAKPCAVCVAAHHSPATATPVVSVAVPITTAAVAVYASVSSPVRRDHSPHSGRAPPTPLSDSV